MDWDQLADMKDLMKDKFPKFVEISIKSMNDHMIELNRSLSPVDLSVIHSASHTIASTAAYLGLTDVHNLSKEIEDIADKQVEEGVIDITPILPLVEELKHQFKSGVNSLIKDLEEQAA